MGYSTHYTLTADDGLDYAAQIGALSGYGGDNVGDFFGGQEGITRSPTQ